MSRHVLRFLFSALKDKLVENVAVDKWAVTLGVFQ